MLPKMWHSSLLKLKEVKIIWFLFKRFFLIYSFIENICLEVFIYLYIYFLALYPDYPNPIVTCFHTEMPIIKSTVLSVLFSISFHWAVRDKPGGTEGHGRTGYCAGVAGGTRPENTHLISQKLRKINSAIPKWLQSPS